MHGILEPEFNPTDSYFTLAFLYSRGLSANIRITGTARVSASIASTLWPSLSAHNSGAFPSIRFAKNIRCAVDAYVSLCEPGV